MNFYQTKRLTAGLQSFNEARTKLERYVTITQTAKKRRLLKYVGSSTKASPSRSKENVPLGAVCNSSCVIKMAFLIRAAV